MCSFCSPDPFYFSNVMTLPKFTICQTFCDDWYSACNIIDSVSDRFSAFNITSGTELCNNIPAATVLYQELQGEEDPAPLVEIVIADGNCFIGENPTSILEASCVPWVREIASVAINNL